MIKIQQLIKTLNNMEAHRRKTKDSYLRMTKGIDIDGFFDDVDKQSYTLKMKRSLNEITVRVEKCHDGIRIYNMGKITNEKNGDLWGGDKIILEKTTCDNHIDYYIDYRKENYSIFFQPVKKLGFEVLTPHKMDLIKNLNNIKISYLGSCKPRSDSEETEYYDIIIDDLRIAPSSFDKTELLKMDVKGDKCIWSKTTSWEYYQFIMEA